MVAMQERNFHLLMLGLLLTALCVDPVMSKLLDNWSPPEIGIFPIVVVFLWIARYAVWKSHCAERDTRRVREQVLETERRLSAQIESLARQLGDRRMRKGLDAQ
ncbi:MAG: hypothetical protein KDB80_07050 [Planctomycetes bacterium]|nr:hypothetical protein [Planctomycetota bacterium]